MVTGCGLVSPLGADKDSTWKALMEGASPIRRLQGPEWKLFENPRAAQVLEAWIPEAVIRRDRSLQLGVVAAAEAWRSADLFHVPPQRIGTTFSSSKGGVRSLLAVGEGPTVSWDFLSDFFPHAAGQLLGHRFGLSGPALSLASACSTGIGSIALGARLLSDGDCDAVLVGSTESSLHPLLYAAFRNMGVLSEKPEGTSPFNRDRDGFLMGEGSAVLVLEKEKTARKRKAPLLARLSAWALGADAYKALEMEPDGKSVLPLVEKSLRMAGLKPSDIGYINAHGTGTLLNDRVESEALWKIFGEDQSWVSSTKGATGHLLGAAGSVEAVLAVMALNRGQLPDTRNLSQPDPRCRVRHVERGGMAQKVEHVLSLSYGFGGQLGAVIFSRV